MQHIHRLALLDCRLYEGLLYLRQRCQKTTQIDKATDAQSIMLEKQIIHENTSYILISEIIDKLDTCVQKPWLYIV